MVRKVGGAYLGVATLAVGVVTGTAPAMIAASLLGGVAGEIAERSALNSDEKRIKYGNNHYNYSKNSGRAARAASYIHPVWGLTKVVDSIFD